MASSANNGNQGMDIDGSSSSANLNINGGEREVQNEEVRNLPKTQEEPQKNEEENTEELKSLQEKYSKELEEATNEEKQLKETIEETEEDVRHWTDFGMQQRQTILELRDTVRQLMERIEELEGRVEQYESANEREEGQGESDDMVQPEGNEIGKCRECMERKATRALVPCMHLCFCRRCNDRFDRVEGMPPCPVCGTLSTTFAIVRLR